ncbi:MAG TPA: M1 family metallopeptidase, partial [Bryobacteraceae bacterium]|nr:M1 family metallopeptidase [Bryobacteraceae bacterium]
MSAAPGEAPKLRLGSSVLPRHYAVELTLEPGRDTFSGVADIDVDVRQPQETIWLNVLEISIRDASIGGKAAKTVAGNAQVIGLSTGKTVPAGRTRLHIAYDGRISKKSSAGIFQLQEDNRWYLYTQFEPTDARRAFPCFDEPGFKTPWDIALRVPKDQMAFANTPQAAESDGGNGMKLVRFATSRPLPSYLVAVAVGPFEVVDLGKVGRKNTPMRVIVPHGKKDEAKYAAESVPQLFKLLEDYFGMPYPYSKLDSIVMPISNFAMENVGLITYGESLLLAKPDKDTINRQRSSAIVTAHEMAHQWFGDLVTTAWWDDIWLNEAFATWMEGKIVAEWKPEWHVDTSEINDRLGAMATDSLVTTRKIRQPIASDDDIANAFDDITYQKGAAV